VPSERKSPVAVAVLLLSLQLALNIATAATPSSFAICNANIFDGTRLIAQHSVVVRDGKIVSVTERCESSPGTVAIDGMGDTLLPGLFDSHVHIGAGEPALRQMLVFGVTTALDMFSDPKIDARIRKAEAEGDDLDLADLRSAGILATAPRGHGTEYGLPIPTISDASEAQQFVDNRIREGSDYIKIVYDNGEEFGDRMLTILNGEQVPARFPSIRKDTLAALIAAAHRRDKMAVVHVLALTFAEDALESGADGLEHIFADQPTPADFAALVKSHHVFVTPTLAAIQSIVMGSSGIEFSRDERLRPFLSRSDIGNLSLPVARGLPLHKDSRMNYSFAAQAVRELHAAGVPILAGDDAPLTGTVWGASIHQELQLLAEPGLTPAEALASATSVPAQIFGPCCGLADRGRIAPGMRADLLLVRGGPTRDITATCDIVAVWKAGVRCDREAHRRQISSESR